MFSLLYVLTLTSIHDYWKNHSFDYVDLYQQSNVSAFYMLSKFIIILFPRRKHLLILWLQLPYAVILEPKKKQPNIYTSFALHFSLFILVMYFLQNTPTCLCYYNASLPFKVFSSALLSKLALILH